MNKFLSVLKMLPLIITSTSYAATVNLSSVSEGGSSDFSGELLESRCAKTGVVMFHGRGSSPRGPVVEELRASLNRAGYTTLSIENPIPSNGQTDFNSYINEAGVVFPEAYARMRAAINHLQSLGVEEVVIAGFSLGSRFASAHAARGQINELPVLGLLGIGMYGTGIDPLNVSFTLDEVSVPVLDIYGDVDTNAAGTAANRLNAYNSGPGLSYTQLALTCIAGTNCHQLEGIKGNDSMPLEFNVSAWMQAVAPASTITDCGVNPPGPIVAPEAIPDAGALNAYLSLFLMFVFFTLRGDCFRKR